MKNTKLMLVSITVFAITYLLAGLIGYLLSDYTYKECLLNAPIILFMLTLGWIPALVVSQDYKEYLNKY